MASTPLSPHCTVRYPLVLLMSILFFSNFPRFATSTITAETKDGDILCDFFNTVANQGALSGWCGGKGSDFNYMSGPCSLSSPWRFVSCEVVGGTNRVTKADLFPDSGDGYNFQGSLPSTIGGLNALTYLCHWGNGIGGTIPSQMGSLTALVSLQLNGNRFLGGIPATFGNLKSLTWLDFSYNQMSGNIPSELGQLTKLSFLSIHSNQFTGAIPDSLCTLEKEGCANMQFDSNPGLSCVPSCMQSSFVGALCTACSPPWSFDCHRNTYRPSAYFLWDGSTVCPTPAPTSGCSTTWVQQWNAGLGNWQTIASSSDGTKLVAAKTNSISTTTDSGVTWTSKAIGTCCAGASGLSSSADGSKLYGVDGSTIWISHDSGVTWSSSSRSRKY